MHTVTHSTAVQLDDLSGDGEKMRTTRTPARPDLAERLKKMRRDKKERELGMVGADDVDIVTHQLERSGGKWGRVSSLSSTATALGTDRFVFCQSSENIDEGYEREDEKKNKVTFE